MASILWFQFPAFEEQGEQILVSEFYHNENQNKNASFSEKAWRFLHVNINVLKINEKGGDACFFSRNTPPTILQALRRQCLRHLCELLRVQFSCAPIWLVAWSVRAMAWWGHVKKRKPHSRTPPTVDRREPCAGWWWQLIQNVQEMSYSEKKNKN